MSFLSATFGPGGAAAPRGFRNAATAGFVSEEKKNTSGMGFDPNQSQPTPQQCISVALKFLSAMTLKKVTTLPTTKGEIEAVWNKVDTNKKLLLLTEINQCMGVWKKIFNMCETARSLNIAPDITEQVCRAIGSGNRETLVQAAEMVQELEKNPDFQREIDEVTEEEGEEALTLLTVQGKISEAAAAVNALDRKGNTPYTRQEVVAILAMLIFMYIATLMHSG